jgi:hypothetical protein
MPSFLSRAFDSRYSKVSTHPFGRVAPLIGSENATFERPYVHPMGKLVAGWFVGYPLAWLILQLTLPGPMEVMTPAIFFAGWSIPLMINLYATTCWSIRRLHDGAHSGIQLMVPVLWFALLFVAGGSGALAGQKIAENVDWVSKNVAAIMLMSIFGSVAGSIILSKLKEWTTRIYDSASTPGHNKYGPPAKKA